MLQLENDYVPDAARQSIAAPARSNKDVALELVTKGMYVFACTPDKEPPRGFLWKQQASNDPATVERMFCDPAYVPAIPAWLNGLLVIDPDVKQGGDGIGEWMALCSANGIDLTEAVIVETPSGGRHYYYSTDVEYSQAKLSANVDVRSPGYVIAPGATMPDGGSYRMIQGDGKPIPALPDALAALLEARRPDAPPAAPGAILGTATQRDLDYFLKPFEAERAKLRALSEQRNEALMKLAKHAGNFIHYGFDRSLIAQALYEDSVANGYVAEHGSAKAWTTIRHNIRDGMTKPRELKSAESETAEQRAQVRAPLDGTSTQFGIQVTEQPRPLRRRSVNGSPFR